MDGEQSDFVTWDGPLTVSDEHMLRFETPPFQSLSFVGDDCEMILSVQVDEEGDRKDLAFFVRGERASDEQIGAAFREWAKAYLKTGQ
jgi:hypothetical protein